MPETDVFHPADLETPPHTEREAHGLWRKLGPGLITGAADDDPGGIATHSQAGAQFGVDILWTVIATWPLMIAIQSVSARIGRVTGKGLAANLTAVFPRPVVIGLVGLLFLANTVNIGADVAAMGAAGNLVTGWDAHLLTLGFAILTLGLQVFVPYHVYVRYLKWLTLVLFAYVGVVISLRIDWAHTLARTVWPHLALTTAAITTIVAVFGTTISPYMLFWQASEEVEDDEADPTTGPLITHPGDAAAQLSRIRLDTLVGMGVANLIAYFIILTTASTLYAHGVTDIESSAQAAQALRPIAGDFAFLLFALGIIGTGLLAVPVLAGSSAYAIGEAAGWRTGLEWNWREARAFYAVIAGSVLLGLGVGYLPIDPIRALYWSAVLNGVIAVPIIAAMMWVASRSSRMGAFTATPLQQLFGWLTVAVMGAAAVAMLVLR